MSEIELFVYFILLLGKWVLVVQSAPDLPKGVFVSGANKAFSNRQHQLDNRPSLNQRKLQARIIVIITAILKFEKKNKIFFFCKFSKKKIEK